MTGPDSLACVEPGVAIGVAIDFYSEGYWIG